MAWGVASRSASSRKPNGLAFEKPATRKRRTRRPVSPSARRPLPCRRMSGSPLILLQGKGRLADGLTGLLVLLFLVAGFSNARPLGFREEADLDATPQAIATSKLKDTPYEAFQPIWVR